MNQYQLTDEISKSEKSTVYKGRKRKAVEYYAIISIDKGRREGVLNWAQTLRSFDHPNIIRFYNWYETSNHLWLITEYCAGGNLRAILSEGAQLNESCICAYAEDIAMGLLYMHTHGTLYNDLHPTRLLLDFTATLRFYNFILSCPFKAASEHPAIGVPLYMSPERFFGPYGLTSTASDLWAFGCVLYEMAAGEPPFVGKDLSALMYNIFNKPVKKLVHTSEEFNRLISILLEKNPLKRATWKEVAASTFWETPLPLPAEGLPHEPAFEAYKKEHNKKTQIWTSEEVTRIIECCTTALNINGYNRNDMSEDASISTLDVSKEHNFQVALTEETYFNKAANDGAGDVKLTKTNIANSNNNNNKNNNNNDDNGSNINVNEPKEVTETVQDVAAAKLPQIGTSARSDNSRNVDNNTITINNNNAGYVNATAAAEEDKTKALTQKADAIIDGVEKETKPPKHKTQALPYINRAIDAKENANIIVNKNENNNGNNKNNNINNENNINLDVAGKNKSIKDATTTTTAAAAVVDSNKQLVTPKVVNEEHIKSEKRRSEPEPTERQKPAEQGKKSNNIQSKPPIQADDATSVKENNKRVAGEARNEENDRKSPSNVPRISANGRMNNHNKVTEETKRTTNTREVQELNTCELMSLSDLILHSSDAHIRPICMNNNIERFPRPTFRKENLGFPPYNTETIVNMTNDELTEFIHTIYTRLSSSKQQDDRLNLMNYFLTLCTDTITATILVNSSVVPLCLFLAKPDSGSETQRVLAIAIIGLLIRYATVVEADLANSGVVTTLTNLFSADSSIKVRRKLVAAIGEFIFYVVSQPAENHSQWGVNADNVRRIFTFALQSDDEVLQHYAAKTIENVISTEEKSSLNVIFCTEMIVRALIKIYDYHSRDGHNEHLRSTALCSSIKLCIMRPTLTHIIWSCPSLPRRAYGSLLESSNILRTAQMLLNFINFAMLNALTSMKSQYIIYLTSPPRLYYNDDDDDKYADVFSSSNLQMQKSNTRVNNGTGNTTSNNHNHNINAGKGNMNTIISTTVEHNYANGNNRKRSASAMNLKNEVSLKRSSTKPSLTAFPVNSSIGESSTFSGHIFTPMEPELARVVLKEMCDIAIGVMDHLHHSGDHIAPPMRGKICLFLVLLGCCAGDTFARLCTSQYISFVDRILRDQDIYIRRCGEVFISFVSLFIRDKLESVAQRISSSTTQLYLSALEQLLGAATIRSRVHLPRTVFVSLRECLLKSVTSTLYSAYEDDFHTLVESIMRNPESVIRHGDAICEYLIKPYADMLQGKENKRRFVAIRFLMSVVSTLASNKSNAVTLPAENNTAVNASSEIVSSVARVLPTLLTAVNPTPTHTLRLLQTCAEWVPASMEPLATEHVVRELIDWIANLSKLEPFCPISLLSNILSLPEGKPALLRYVAVEEFTLLMSILLSAQEEDVETTIEDCCYLMMHAVESVKDYTDTSTTSTAPTWRNTGNSLKRNEGSNSARRNRRNSSVQKVNSSPTATRNGATRVRSASKNDTKSCDLSQMRTCCNSSCVRKILLPLCAYPIPTAKYAISIAANLTNMFSSATSDLFSRDAAVLYVKLVKKSDSDSEYTYILTKLLECMCSHITECEPHPEMLRSNSPFASTLQSTTKPPWSDVIRKQAIQLSKCLSSK